ncbi:MAG: PaaI family thioesterase [Polyangiales bacterium]|nr:PaaI family thioesterase [Myxococcales bacterium]MCB9661671.1 PaaI family thioesterase [Sandaracinaceae bacterium]
MPTDPQWMKPPEHASSPDWAAQRELASAVRALIADCIETRADADTLASVTEAVRAVSATLAGHPRIRARDAYREGHYRQHPERFVDQGAMLGRSNPVAGPLVLRREGERVVGEISLGPAHGGAPGLVHGGVVATLLDEVLGHAAISTGVSVVTATLNVRYHAPTPLGVTLRCEGWIAEHTGRRFKLKGQILAGDKRTASAEGVFVDVSGDRFDAIMPRAAEG